LATQLVREAGRTIGEVLASAVSLLNPSVIVIGGSLSAAGDPLLAGVREVVYRRSLPLATAALRIVQASAGDRSGVVGAAVMVIEDVLAPDAVDRYVS
jgi:predicted NBD/HSP70 family sugar kinase